MRGWQVGMSVVFVDKWERWGVLTDILLCDYFHPCLRLSVEGGVVYVE